MWEGSAHDPLMEEAQPGQVRAISHLDKDNSTCWESLILGNPWGPQGMHCWTFLPGLRQGPDWWCFLGCSEFQKQGLACFCWTFVMSGGRKGGTLFWHAPGHWLLLDNKCVLFPVSNSPLQPRSRDKSRYNAANGRGGLRSCCWDLLCPCFCFTVVLLLKFKIKHCWSCEAWGLQLPPSLMLSMWQQYKG